MWQARFPDNRLLLLEEAARRPTQSERLENRHGRRGAAAATGGLRCGKGGRRGGRSDLREMKRDGEEDERRRGVRLLPRLR